VPKEVQHFNWIKNSKQINIEELLDEFVLLFSTLADVQLTEDKDAIVWKWTKDEEYSRPC
jgi:hypothetical protein